MSTKSKKGSPGSKKGSPGSKKRSLAESGKSSKPKKTRSGPDPLDTIRFLPLDDDEPMITKYLVACYTRQFGQDLYMIANEEERYIDVLFADKKSADNVKSKFQDPKHRPPFKMAFTSSIDESQLLTPGEVTFYHHPRDLDHDDTQPSLPLGWNNPNPVTFEFPPADVADVAPQAADVAAPEADVARVVQHSNPETAKQSRQPRVKARYPPTAQPPPPSSRPPFQEPEWPTPPTYVP